MLFYLSTLVTAPTTAPTTVSIAALIAIPTRAFAKAQIVTPVIAAPVIASNITIALTAAMVALAVQARRLATTSIFNNCRSSTKKREKRGKTTHDSTRGRESHERIPTPYIIGVSFPASPSLPSFNWPTSALLSNANSNSKEERLKKKIGIKI